MTCRTLPCIRSSPLSHRTNASSTCLQENIVEVEVDVRDGVVLHMVNPNPPVDTWRSDSLVLNLNHQRRSVFSTQPTAWGHSTTALMERLDAMAVE